jgi:hypothetical protein
MLDHALDYARSGLAVLPLHWPTERGCSCGRDCASPGKHPLGGNGKDHASTDAGIVTEWFTRWPHANIGVRPPDGVLVLDVDVQHRGDVALLELTERHGPLAPTLTARTGSGGLHVWYAYAGPARGTLCDGVDLKHHGGYLVAPPSVHISGRVYGWANDLPTAPLPGWIREMLTPTPRPRLATMRRRAGGKVDALVRTISGAKERNNALFWASCRALECGLDVNPLREAAFAAGLDESEAEKTIASAANTTAHQEVRR